MHKEKQTLKRLDNQILDIKSVSPTSTMSTVSPFFQFKGSTKNVGMRIYRSPFIKTISTFTVISPHR